MPKKLTKKQLGAIQLSSGWTEAELNDPSVLAIRKQLEEEQARREAAASAPAPSFANVVGNADTVPAQQPERSGIMGLLDGIDSFISREQGITNDALVGGAKRSAGAGLFSATDNPLMSYLQNTLNNARMGPAGALAQVNGSPAEQDNGSMQVGGNLFQEGSNQVNDAYKRSQQHDSWLGRQVSGGLVDALSSPSSALSIAGGGVGLFGAGLDTGAQEYTAGRLAGLSREDAAKRAGMQGGIEGLFSALPTGHAFESLVPSGVRRELMGTVPKIVANVLATAGGEAAEETATTAAQLLADKVLANGDNKKLADYANSNLPKNGAGVAEALWRSARAGGLMGGAIKTPHALFEAALDNANHAAQIIATGEQAVAERGNFKSDTSIPSAKPTQAVPTQGELFGGESSPLASAPETAPVVKPNLPAGPDLFPKETADFLASRTAASKLIDSDAKSITSTAKSARAAARRTFLTKLTAQTRDVPKADRIEQIARATEQWDAANPMDAFLAKAAAPKTGKRAKGKKVEVAPVAKVSPVDLLKKFDGLAQESIDNPDSTPPKDSGAIEHVFRAMVKKVGKGDVKVLNKLMQDGNLKVVEDPSFIPTKKPLGAGTKGYYDGNTTYVVAKNIDPKNVVGDMLSVAAHETKHAADISGNETLRANVAGLVGKAANDSLVDKIEALGTKDRGIGELVTAIKKKHPNQNIYKLELPAYFINHAIDKKNKSLLVNRVLGDAVSAVRVGAKRKLNIDDVNTNDVAYLAKSLLKEAAVSGERLDGDLRKVNNGGLEMIGGATATDFDQNLKDNRVYVGKVDALPRFEFSDHESKVDSHGLDFLKRDTSKPMKLFLLLDHPELYKQYPQLRDYNVKIDPTIDSIAQNANGYYSASKHSLAISPKVAQNPDKTRSVLLHEIQHAIQEIEGFVPGANSKTFESRSVKDGYNESRQFYNDFIDSFDLEGAVESLPENRRKAWDKNVASTVDGMNPENARKAMIHLFFKGKWHSDADEFYDKQADLYNHYLKQFDNATKKLDEDRTAAHKTYLKDYGETEARTTQLRRNLTSDERQLITPEEDMKYAEGKVPVEDTIDTRTLNKSPNTTSASVDDTFNDRLEGKRVKEFGKKLGTEIRERAERMQAEAEAGGHQFEVGDTAILKQSKQRVRLLGKVMMDDFSNIPKDTPFKERIRIAKSRPKTPGWRVASGGWNVENPDGPQPPGSWTSSIPEWGMEKPIQLSSVKNLDTEGLAFIPHKYTVGSERVKGALRIAERLLWPGGFVDSTLKEITGHASSLPASLMVKATKYGNDMLSAISKNAAEVGKGRTADEQRKIRQRLRVDLGKAIEQIDKLPTKAERDAALDALDRNPRFAGIGQAVRAIRDFKMELTREIIALRQRDPKPLTEKETAVYTKMTENAERYTTRAYLSTYNDKIGVKYGKNLWKRFERDPDSQEGKIVQTALEFLKDNELVIPDTDSLYSMGTMQLRRMYENWVGSSTQFKGDKGRRAMIRALSDLPDLTKEMIDAKATEIVKDMLNLNKNKGVSARFYSIGSKQNRTILESRTDMPPELRALMGEITDPFLREAISLQRMINLSAKTKLLTEVFEAGASRSWWSPIKTDSHETQLNDIAYGPMNGKWINKDLEDALTGTVLSLESTDKVIADSIHNPTAFSQYLAGKSVKMLTGMSRVQKTYRIVFNAAQMLFNGGGAFLNLGLNGIVNPKTAWNGIANAAKVLGSEINTKVVNEGNLPTIQEIVRAGVIDSATVGEFKSQAYQNITEQIQKLDPDQPGYMAHAGKILWDFVSAQGDVPNAVRQVYAYMDIWTKVATYYDRKNFLTEYNKLEGKKWTDEQIQRRAGYEASGTNISYERAIPLAKIIEKNLPFGMFLTYFTEVPRTIGTSMIQAGIDAKMAMEAKDPKAKALATAKATTRFLGTVGVTAGVIAGTLHALSNDDDEEKKRRRLDPQWMQNKYTMPIGQDAEGHTVLFETNRFDPNGPLNEAIVAILAAPEGKRAEAVYNQVLGLFVPAQGAIAAYRVLNDMVVEAAARATGNASLYEADMASKRTVMERNYPNDFAKLKHVLSYGDFGENAVAMIEQLWLPASAQPLVDQKGRVITVRPRDKDMKNIPQDLGYRPYVRNPDESFDFRVKDYTDTMKAIMKDRGKLIRDADKLDESTLIGELNDMVAREKEAFDNLRYNYEGYMAYEGKTLKDASEHFDNKRLFQQIRYNKFRPSVVSQQSLQSWARQQIKQGRDKAEVRAVYDLLRKAYTDPSTTEIE